MDYIQGWGTTTTTKKEKKKKYYWYLQLFNKDSKKKVNESEKGSK